MKLFRKSSLFLLTVTWSLCNAQYKTKLPNDDTNSETREIVNSHGPNSSVRAIRQDRKGNIWLASNEGIIRYDGKFFTNVTGNLFPDRFFSVLEDRKGNFWFGNYGSGAYYYNGKSIQHFTDTEGLFHKLITSVYEDKHGNIWFGANGGASSYDGTSFRNYTMSGDTEIEERPGKSSSDGKIGANGVNHIIEDKTGRVWYKW